MVSMLATRQRTAENVSFNLHVLLQSGGYEVYDTHVENVHLLYRFVSYSFRNRSADFHLNYQLLAKIQALNLYYF